MTDFRLRAVDIIHAEVEKWLELEDDLLPDIVLVAALANRLDGPPVWLMIVAPPASAKSDLIMGLSGLKGVRHLSSITAKTFASGLRPEPGQKQELLSLLAQLQAAGNWLVTIKDFGTIQSLKADVRNGIFGQLREIYDGQFNAAFGSGVTVDWQGKLGLIVGATPEVDRLSAWSGALGERFVQFRPLPTDHGRVALRAIRTVSQDHERHDGLAKAFREAYDVAQGELAGAALSPEGSLAVTALAQLVAVARTPIQRDKFSGGFQVAATEGPGRLVKILGQLYRAGVVYYDGDHEAAMRLVVRVGLDSIPGRRGATLRLLARASDGVAVGPTARALRCDENTAQRELDDLVALGLAERGKPVNRVVYQTSAEVRDYAARIYLDEYDPAEAMQRLFDLPSGAVANERG